MFGFLTWLSDVIQGKRFPHWFYILLMSAGAGAATYSFSRTIEVDPAMLGRMVQSTGWPLCAATAAFLTSLCTLLLYFYSKLRPKTKIIVFDGEMRYEDEIHLAIRVATLKNLIASMVEKLDTQQARQALYRAGETAGTNFGKQFPKIYIDEIKSTHPVFRIFESMRWKDLDTQKKFDLWGTFDKGAGWGTFRIIDHGAGGVQAQIDHVSMFTGSMGPMVAMFMAGYVAGVAQEISARRLQLSSEPVIGGNKSDRVTMQFAKASSVKP